MNKVELYESLLRLAGTFLLLSVLYVAANWMYMMVFYDAPTPFGFLLFQLAAGTVVGWVLARMPEVVISFVWGSKAYSSE